MTGRDARRQSVKQLHERRKEVVRLHRAGHRVMEIVALTGLSWPAVRHAIDAYLAGGEAAIEPAPRGKRSGEGRRLLPQQEAELRAKVLGFSPAALGVSEALLWSRDALVRLVEREAGVVLSTRAIGDYQHRWGFAPSRPSLRAQKGTSMRWRRWLASTWPAIAREARQCGAEVHWLSILPLAAFDPLDAAVDERAEGWCRLGVVGPQGKARWRIAKAPLDGKTLSAFLADLEIDCGTSIRVVAGEDELGPGQSIDWDDPTCAHRVILAPPRSNQTVLDDRPASEKEATGFDGNTLSGKDSDGSSAGFEEVSRGSSLLSSASAAEDGRPGSAALASVESPARGSASGGGIMRRRTAVLLSALVAAVAVPLFLLPKAEPEAEVNPKPMLGDYWAHRVAYPTMNFSPGWYEQAKPQDLAVRSGIPAGERPMARTSLSPLALDPAAWTFLGPRPLQNGSYGIVSGRTNVIAVDPRGPDIDGFHTVYAASDGGGVWKSTNCCSASTTWRNVTDQPDIASIAIGDLYIEPSNPDVVYAGTGDLRYGSFSFGSSGVLKSVDRGETWEVLGEDVFSPFYPPSAGLAFPQYQAVGKVVSSPRDAQTLIVGTKTGLYVSNNGGTDWTGPCYTNSHATQRQDITGLIAQDVGGQTRLIAAVGTRGNPTTVQPDLANLGANGVYRATLPASGCPALTDWTLLANGWPAGTGNGNPAGKTLGRIELAAARTNPDVIYAMGAHATASNVLGVWRSNDGGTTWTQRATTSSIQGGGCSLGDGGGSQMWYDAGLTVDPNDAETVLLSGVDLYRSRDGGSTFQDVTCGYGNGNVHVDQHARAYLPSGGGNFDSDKLLAGGDGGVYFTSNIRFGTGGSSSTNRPTFISLNQTIGSIELYSGDITANFAEAASPGASAGAQDNGSSWVRWTNTDPSPAQWTVRNGGDGIYTRIEPVRESRWYYSSQNGALVVSTNGPNSTPSVAYPSNWGGDTLSFVMPFEIYRYGELDVAGSGCTSAVGCTYLIAGTTRVWETLSGAIPSSSWYANSPNLTKGTLGNRSFINQLAHATRVPSVAIAGTNDGNVHYGHGLNQGVANSATWVNLTAGNAVLPNRPVMDVTIDVADAANPAAIATGYAVLGGFDQNTPTTPGHVYQVSCTTHCATFSWRNVSGNLPNIPVNAVAVNPHQPLQVFAGSDWGLYYTDDVSAASPTWQRFDNGLPRVMIWDMAIDRGFTTLAVFTRGRGVWAWPLPTAASDIIFRNGFDP